MATSCVIHHGPSARASALAEANLIGRLVCPPIGDDGLKVDDARQVTERLLSTPVGEQVGVVVIGPMDEANAKASDTLLKCLEEFPGEWVVPILWANDLGEVSVTIRSRCRDKWCPGIDDDDERTMEAAHKIIEAALVKDMVAVVELAKPFDKAEIALVSALTAILALGVDQAPYRGLWGRLRPVAAHRKPFLSEVIVALVGGAHV